MIYRVILTRNGEYKKTLHKSKTRATSFINFRKIKAENEKVMFPKRFVNYNGIKPVVYKIYVVKDVEEGDDRRVLSVVGDQITYEEPIFGIWTVLDSYDYNFEEKFWVYGFDPKTQRKTIHDVIKLLMKGVNNVMLRKEIIVVNNKLVIYSEEQFDMVICKCKRDAQRLHHTLFDCANTLKIKNLLFMGTATEFTIGDMYEIIQEETGWPYLKVIRTTTRP